MELFTYLSEFGTHPLPGSGHGGLYAGLGVVAAFLLRSAYKDLTRPDSVPADAGPDPRLPLFRETVASLWVVALCCFVAWLAAGGSLAALGFRLPAGVGGWVGNGLATLAGAVVLVQAAMVARSEDVRRRFAVQLDEAKGYDWIRPGSASEYRWFQAMAFTAGVTEEVVFRGFLIGTLALWMSPWAAAAARC